MLIDESGAFTALIIAKYGPTFAFFGKLSYSIEA
jgi:hypothetical protein